jgi:hypothetical protein
MDDWTDHVRGTTIAITEAGVKTTEISNDRERRLKGWGSDEVEHLGGV